MSLIRYTAESCVEVGNIDFRACVPSPNAEETVWINVDGIHQVEVVTTICGAFGVHPLAIEDLLNPNTRTKVDDYGDHIVAAAKMVNPAPPGLGGMFELEQVGVVVGQSWVLTFQERPGDGFESIRARLRGGAGRIRKSGPDYLLHALLDSVVDVTAEVILSVDQRIDDLEAQPADLHVQAHELRAELVSLRRAVAPLREAISALLRAESALVREHNKPYYRDLYDHVAQALDLIDSNRERVMSLVQLHLAENGHRLNEVMQVLTIVATMFIPLTFVVGVYGMNFEHMPELQWRYGYPAVWVVMVLMVLGMLVWFRSRRWL
ncbi:magnesium/cobalt transporter CorA [Myxococcota bacterium]|nr:magnesium/cobalt transporter CorA [Myxococcota bacterium]